MARGDEATLSESAGEPAGRERAPRRRRKAGRKAHGAAPIDWNAAREAGAGEEAVVGTRDRIDPELAQLAAEAQAAYGDQAAAPADHVPAETASVRIEPGMIRGAVSYAVKGAETALCRKLEVSDPSDDEAAMMSEALINVLDVYGLLDLDNMQPTTAAWFNLGMVALAFAVPRAMELAMRKPQQQPAPIPEPGTQGGAE